ncbi:hypothetical protein V1515DRAFT_579405 [Lipomyces mesembrius]
MYSMATIFLDILFGIEMWICRIAIVIAVLLMGPTAMLIALRPGPETERQKPAVVPEPRDGAHATWLNQADLDLDVDHDTVQSGGDGVATVKEKSASILPPSDLATAIAVSSRKRYSQITDTEAGTAKDTVV